MLIASAALIMFTSGQEQANQPSRVCVAVFSDAGENHDITLQAATAHCRRGDVLDFYDRSSPAITDYNVARVCDLRFPVRLNNTSGATAAFTCVYSGVVRTTVRAAN